MVGEGDAAIGTLEGQATIRAEDEVGEAPTIEEEETLFLLFDISVKGRPHFLGEERPLLSEIDDLHLGKGLPLDPLQELKEAEFPGFGIVVGFE